MTRVFVLEDSPTIRSHLLNVFEGAGDFEVVGMAGTAAAALEGIAQLKPDLVTVDVFLQDASAADVVRKIHAWMPIPVVLLSGSPRETTQVFDALAAGAVDFMRKPRAGEHAAWVAMLNALRALTREPKGPKRRTAVERRPPPQSFSVVTIASSTGGPNALNELFSELPKDFPLPIVIAQHLSEGFEEGLTRWLGRTCSLNFEVVRESAAVRPGQVLLSHANRDIFFTSKTEVVCRMAEPGGYHPSGDVLMGSAARVFGPESIAVVMSGIGTDGTDGAMQVKDAGGFVMSQSAATSVVYGMPKSVEESGLSSYVGSPRELAQCLVRCANARPRGNRRA